MAEEAAGAGTAAAASAGPVVLKSGQVIQNYEIVKPLGKGKFSIVYMAKRLTDGTMCALKKINIFDMMVPKQREKCLKEVRLLQSLDHPNIVKLKDSFIDNNELLIIVEWAEKGDLKRLIRRALSMEIRFKDIEIWEYSRQLASALEHMHKKRIMHRDLKPANIFVTMGGSLKLGDLGLGRFFSSQTLEAFSKVGTPLYMSPEVLRGAGYDMRSDVWSLGCVLYELAMLRSPFKSDQQLSLYDLFVRISKGEYPPLPETVCAEFRDLVGRMLALDPEKRLHCAQVLDVCNARMALLTSSLARKDKDDPTAQKSSEKQRVCRPSPLLVMDDIVEKLKLLECEEQFLRPRGYPILHRCFFAQKVELPGQATQFEVMYELMRWLLAQVASREAASQQQAVEREEAADVSAGPPCKAPGRSVPGSVAEADAGAGDAAAGPGAVSMAQCGSKGNPDDLTRDVVSELAARGIQISSEATLSQLQQGHGEGVCLILNELINRELVGRDFHFEAPRWSEVMATGDAQAEEVAEDLDGSESERSEGTESEGPADDAASDRSVASGTQRARTEAASARAFEKVHEAHVDVEAWKAEVERVKPLLRMSADVKHGPLGGWQSTVYQTKELCRRVETLCRPVLPEVVNVYCRYWQRHLQELRCHEERLNVLFAPRAAEAARTREAAQTEGEAVAVLQSSVASLSETLSNLCAELEKSKGEAANQTEVALDTGQLTSLRQATQKIRDECRELAQRVGCLQSELLARQLRRPPSEREGQQIGEPPPWHPDAEECSESP